MTRPLVVLGAGGHAKMVIEAARSGSWYEPLVCLSATQVDVQHLLGVRIEVETPERLEQLRRAGYWAIVAIGENRIRRKLQSSLEQRGWPIATVISGTAWCSPSASIEPGTVLMPLSAVGAEARVGRGGIINTSASIDHDCLLSDFVHIAPGSHLAGNVTVANEVFCGVGVSVIPERTIGARTIVGAGAVVVSDIPNDSVWVGCPARPMAARVRAA